MNLFKTCFLIVLSCIVQDLFAQNSPVKFGKIAIDNLKLKKNPLDSSAGALVLMDFGKTTFDHNLEIVLEHHIRIKIFNSSEFDRAIVKIPFATGDKVSRLKASTYNLEGGKIVESELSRKDVFEENVNENVNQKRFTLTDVKEGSIIEYSYTVNYGTWTSLNPWYFQMSLPVLHSEYIVSLPEYFHYKKINSGYVALTDYNVWTKHGHYGSKQFIMEVQQFIAKNVPAFKEEPYMTSRENYISKIQFELSSINIPGSYFEEILPSSYAALSKSYAESESFGKKLTKNPFLKEEVERITSGLTETEDKIASIYKFVRDNFTVDYSVMSTGLKRIYNLKKGHPLDINMILIAMYNEGGFDAKAVKLSTRSNGTLHPLYAMKSKFNYTVCFVQAGEKEYLLDASKKSLPFNVLDKSCLNGRGMLVTADNFRWINLVPGKGNRKVIFGNVELSETGELKGTLDLSRTGYEAIEFRKEHKKNLEEYKETFSEKNATWIINDHKVENMDSIEAPLKENIDLVFDSYGQSMNNIIYFTPIFHGRLTSNPLKSLERKFPVNFSSPEEEFITCSIKIPEGYSIEELPEKLSIRLPGNGMTFIYHIAQRGNFLTVSSRLSVNKPEFSVEEYRYVKEFYAQVVDKHAQQIVLKKNI